MDRIEEMFINLKPEELKEAVKEIANKNETGVYKQDGIVRSVLIAIRHITDDNHYPIISVETAITWEISRRWYNGFYGIIEGETI